MGVGIFEDRDFAGEVKVVRAGFKAGIKHRTTGIDKRAGSMENKLDLTSTEQRRDLGRFEIEGDCF